MPSETTRPQDETRIINVTGQRLRVAIRPGDDTRTPLLLMNGIGVNLEVLQQFVDALDPAIEVIRFDVPGTGDSPVALIPYRFSGLARLVSRCSISWATSKSMCLVLLGVVRLPSRTLSSTLFVAGG
jgi:pimeloyl-ACP methyl ester carboxylesterase